MRISKSKSSKNFRGENHLFANRGFFCQKTSKKEPKVMLLKVDQKTHTHIVFGKFDAHSGYFDMWLFWQISWNVYRALLQNLSSPHCYHHSTTDTTKFQRYFERTHFLRIKTCIKCFLAKIHSPENISFLPLFLPLFFLPFRHPPKWSRRDMPL